MALAEELDALKRSTNARQRGSLFEAFLLRLLKAEGLHVTRNPSCSPDLQVDLFARRGQLGFLVEAKWLTRPMSAASMIGVKERVRRTPQGVFGCVFSMSGYQAGAIREACGEREREIVLFNELEIQRIAAGDLSLDALLTSKRDVLRTHANTWFYDPIVETHPPERLRSCPDVIVVDGETKRWLLCADSAIGSLFRHEYIDFRGRSLGPAFSLHFFVDLRTVSELRRFVRMTRRELGLEDEGSFAIHQGSAGWFGFGVENFVAAVEGRDARYAELKWDHYHHSEELGYVDRIERGGLFGLSLRQSTGGGNHLHTCEVEIFLPGIPVDMSGIERFCQLAGREEEAVLEIVSEDQFKIHHFTPRVKVEPLATIVSETQGEKWVSGLVVKNPFYRKAVSPAESGLVDQPFWQLRDEEHLLCALRSWHMVGERKPHYTLHFAEACWIAGYATFWIVCDWS